MSSVEANGYPVSARATALRAALAAVVPPVVLAMLLLGVWQFASTTGAVPADMLPAPTRVVTSAVAERSAIGRHLLPTLTATIVGFALSVTVAFIVASALDFSKLLRRAVLPLLVVSQTLPLIALAPLVVLWFGFGLTPKILLVAFVTFFPMVVGLLRGFDAAGPQPEHLLRTMGAGRFAVFRFVRLPAATEQFFSALRISITYAVVGAIFAEYAGAVAGLGVYMQSAKNVFRTDLVLAAVLMSSLLTLALYGTVTVIERACVPWLRVERGQSTPAGRAGSRRAQPAIRRKSAEPLALELRGVGKGFGGRAVLADVSFAVAAGEVVSIVGASGSGKSTLLNLLTGAQSVDSGSIAYGDASLAGVPAKARPFAYMPQRDELLPWRRIDANAAIGLEVAGERAAGARALAAESLGEFGLADTERLYPRQLSGGMRQRVSFLRAVIQGRPVLLLDEPFGALDAMTREELQRWLLEVWGASGWTIVLITHDIREAVRLSDRVLVLGGAGAAGVGLAPGASIVGEVRVSRDIDRGDGYLRDARAPALELEVSELLRR